MKTKSLVILGAIIVGIAVLAMLVANKSRGKGLRIGCITPLTGDGATYGAATKRGLDLAMKKINESGGIDGNKVQIIYEDDQMDARVATNAIQKLISIDKVPVIIGAFGSSITLAIAPIAEKDKVVLFSASSTADAIKDAGDYIFRNVPPNKAQGKTAAKFARSYLKGETACVFQMNNDYGVSLAAAFETAFKADGGEILSVDSYNPGSSDFRAQLTKIRSKHPDIIYYPGHYQESGLILKQAKELGVKATFIGGDGSYSPELMTIAGDAAEGTYYTLMSVPYGTPDPDVQMFEKDFEAAYHQQPDVYSAYAYDALMMIAKAIKTGGYSSDGIKSALYAMKGFKGVTGITQFDANGEVDKPFGIYEVKDKNFVRIDWKTEAQK